jgi:hypothetical protein
MGVRTGLPYPASEEDIAFKRQVESCKFPVTEFNHRAHLRLAYVYLSEHDTDSSAERMRDTLNRLLYHNRVEPSKFHETLTRAWIFAVHHFMNRHERSNSADELINQQPEMLDPEIMMTHYSGDVLFSEEARNESIQPNLVPIPRHEE